MGSFSKIINQKELQEEKGIYYPYLMQILGCPVVHGVLIPKTSLKYLYNDYLEGIFDTLIGIINIKTKEKLFPKVVREDFIFSMTWALADCFNGGCDLEDFDEDKAFAFLDKTEKVYVGNNDYWERSKNKNWIEMPKYRDVLITKEQETLFSMFN